MSEKWRHLSFTKDYELEDACIRENKYPMVLKACCKGSRTYSVFKVATDEDPESKKWMEREADFVEQLQGFVEDEKKHLIKIFRQWFERDGIELPKATMGCQLKYSIIQMEMGETTLGNWLLDHNRIKADGLKFFGDTVQGLRYLHQKGYLHRDLHPGNIVIVRQPGETGCASRCAKIIDFEFTREFLAEMTPIKRFAGNSYFRSWETDKNIYDQKSDVYALAFIFLTVHAAPSSPDPKKNSLEVDKNVDNFKKRKVRPQFFERNEKEANLLTRMTQKKWRGAESRCDINYVADYLVNELEGYL